MLGFLGSVLGAGSSLLGGLFGSDAQKQANEANLQMAQENLAFQQRVETQGLQDRAADATAAQTATGINRLALLGAPTFSPSPVSAGQVGDTSMSSGIASAGQDIQRGISAYAEASDRHAELQNKLLEAQIANVNSDTVRNQAAASKQVTQAPTAPTPLYHTYVDSEGNKVVLPSKDASSSLQNGASYISDAAIMGDMTLRNLGLRHPIDSAESWLRSHGWIGSRGDVHRYSRPRVYIDVPNR